MMIESIVRRWIVLSMLTGRYSESSESGELSDAFWNTMRAWNHRVISRVNH